MALVAGANGASAQNISNETWLGQVGGLNTITINQSGRNNQAGASDTFYRLNQNGNDNVLTIDQYGHRNQAGATPYQFPPTGINQVGGSNEIGVRQSTATNAVDGGNVVGAIYQFSSFLLQNTSNLLTIIQNEEGGSGEAHHGVGVIRQIYTGNDSHLRNEAQITQKGGGADAGNFLGYLTQAGRANFFFLLQEVASNVVLSAIQTGNTNRASVTQVAGTHNRVEYLHQWGHRNDAEVTMEGSRNVVEQIFQYNILLGQAAQGNIAKVALHGEGNGGPTGFADQFVSDAALEISVAQANIVQIGELNNVSVTIAGDDNRYGTQQFGENNDAIIALGKPATAVSVVESANENESAVFQSGDDNVMSHMIMGDRNVAAVQQFGNANALEIVQISEGKLSIPNQRGNLAKVFIAGHRNNNIPFADQFADSVELVAASVDLRPGRFYQDGLNNTILASVTGSDNSFGVHQVGNFNSAEMTVMGSFNQVVVVQLGDNNIAIAQQFGNGNTAIIQQ